jgi:DNA-directed RNA polymerase specialized sigma54-like protein
LLLLFFACSVQKDKTDTAPIEKSPDLTPSLEEIARERAARFASSMDDRQLAAQVIITGIDGKGALTRDMKILLSECPAGEIGRAHV